MGDDVLGDGEAEAGNAAGDDGTGIGKIHGKPSVEWHILAKIRRNPRKMAAYSTGDPP
jgi:hypothetical protein